MTLNNLRLLLEDAPFSHNAYVTDRRRTDATLYHTTRPLVRSAKT